MCLAVREPPGDKLYMSYFTLHLNWLWILEIIHQIIILNKDVLLMGYLWWWSNNTGPNILHLIQIKGRWLFRYLGFSSSLISRLKICAPLPITKATIDPTHFKLSLEVWFSPQEMYTVRNRNTTSRQHYTAIVMNALHITLDTIIFISPKRCALYRSNNGMYPVNWNKFC